VAVRDPEKLARLAAAGERLRIDAATAEVEERLELAGVHALLLKGPTIARWLYEDSAERSYLDSDLLVGPAQFEVAEGVIRSLGYRSLLGNMRMPSWWCEHAAVWQRQSDGLTVDLHRTLIGIRIDDATAWRVLSADAEEVVVAGRPVRALGLPARAMHVVLHAAQHGASWPTSIADLERALAVGDEDLWLRAAAVAAELGATAAFGTGLRLTPGGECLAARLGLPRVRSVEAELRSGSSPPLALGFEQLARASDWRMRAEIVWRKLVPTREFLRDWDPDAGDSRFGIAQAYVRRLAWLLRRAPEGLLAWYRARSSVRGGPRS
jgi:hypothetical protein